MRNDSTRTANKERAAIGAWLTKMDEARDRYRVPRSYICPDCYQPPRQCDCLTHPDLARLFRK